MANEEIDVTEEEEAEIEVGPYGAVYMAWDVPEYRRYSRGRYWYLAAGLVGGGLLIYCVLTANFLFALIVLMFALVLYMSSVGAQRMARFALTETGLVIGNSFFPYKDVNRFWLAYDPPVVRALYIEFKSSVRPRMTIDLGDSNPNAVRQVLGTYVREDLEEDGEPLSDIVSRFLKI